MTRARVSLGLVVFAALVVPQPASAQESRPHEGFLDADDGARLYWQALGEAGDTVVYLHGGPGGQAAGRMPDLEPLARSHVVLAFDQRGGGRSPVADTLALTLDAYVADIDALRRHFGLERLTILGHSWGGALAVLYAARHPQHVERLILNGPMPPARVPYDAERSASIERAKRSLCVERLGALANAGSVEECVREPGMNARVYFADTTHIARVAGRGGIDPVTNRVVMRQLGDWDFRPVMGAVRAPTLVIEGRRSPVPLPQIELWARTIQNARILVIDGAGHGYAMIENPDEFFRSVRSFLAGAWPSGAVDMGAAPATPVSDARVSATRLILPAAAGSGLGLVVGGVLGAMIGIGGGDDPGVAGALLFGLAGSAAGSTVAITLASNGRVDPATACSASTTGFLAGAAVAAAIGRLAGDSEAVVIGFVVGQSTFAAVLSALVENTSR